VRRSQPKPRRPVAYHRQHVAYRPDDDGRNAFMSKIELHRHSGANKIPKASLPDASSDFRFSSNNKKTVVFLHDYPPISGGGLARHVLDTSKMLMGRFDVQIYTSRLSDHFADDRNRKSYKSISFYKPGLISLIKCNNALNEFDVVIVNCTYSLRFFVICSAFFNRSTRNKTIFVLHTAAEHMFYNRFARLPSQVRGVLTRVHDWIVARGAACITFSDEQSVAMLKQGVSNVIRLPMIIETDKRHEAVFQKKGSQSASNNIVGFAGEFSMMKGIDRVISLRKRLSKQIEMRLCGNGPLRNELVRFAREESAAGQFEIVDFVDPEQMFTFFDRIDVLIVPSRTETLCRTAVEAMACGVVVFAAPVGGLRQLIESALGQDNLIDFTDSGLVAATIEERLAQKHWLRDKSARGREWVLRNYPQYSLDWPKLVSRVAESTVTV
jgi:glycosyltransferase involved in cell wall biosynthesis